MRIRIPSGGERIEKERFCDTRIEFGKLDPRREGGAYRHVFGLTADATGYGLIKVDLKQSKEHCYWFPEGEFAGEGLFVPKRPDAAEGEGYILSHVYQADRHATYLAIPDAEHLEDGPITRAHFDHHIPTGFHGIWRNHDAANPSLPATEDVELKPSSSAWVQGEAAAARAGSCRR